MEMPGGAEYHGEKHLIGADMLVLFRRSTIALMVISVGLGTVRFPVTHPPCCSCGSAHALSSRVEPRAAPFAVTCHSCTAALVTWYRVSLCVRSSDRGESRSAERRARMVVVCLGPFPIPRIAVWQLGVSTSVLLYYSYTIAIVAYIHTGSCCWRGPAPKWKKKKAPFRFLFSLFSNIVWGLSMTYDVKPEFFCPPNLPV